jgi:aquaporin Z
MNPARSLAPAILSGVLEDLWLYWTATYVGTSIAAFLFRNKFAKQRLRENT